MQQAAVKAAYRMSEHFIPVVDKDPSHPPSGDQPAFRQTAAGEHGNVTAERCQGRRAAAWKVLGKQQWCKRKRPPMTAQCVQKDWTATKRHRRRCDKDSEPSMKVSVERPEF